MVQFWILIVWTFGLALGPMPLKAQDLPLPGKGQRDIHPSDVIIWSAAQAIAEPDGRVLIGLRLSTRDNFSIYKDKLTIEGPATHSLRIISEAPSRRQNDPMGEGEVDVFDGGDFEVELKGDAPFTASSVKLQISFLGCTQRICLWPYTETLEIPVYAKSASAASPAEAPAAAAPSNEAPAGGLSDLSAPGDHPEQAAISPGSGGQLSLEERYAERLQGGELSFILVLLVVLLGGVATNLTPCVFPMIPITIRLLSKQGHRPLAAALVYASGIVLTYTSLGLIASLSGGIFGSLLANPLVNIAFALIFIVLGLTMLGFGDLSKLQNLGAQLGAGKASYLNAFGMGAGAGLVAAPCTGPIMGALLAYATKLGSPSQALLLFFLYSLGFALPYVFLGIAANRVATIRVGPRVQVGTKIFFAAAMFALAAYYLKNPAHQALLAFTGYWSTAALTLLGLSLVLVAVVVRHPHLIHLRSAYLLPTFVLGLGLFAAIQWANGADIKTQLHWNKDEAAAYATAKAENKPLLIDGWADWCVACKKMDQTTFVDPGVISLLQDDWVLVKLDFTETTEANEALGEKYEMPGLPTLVLVPSDGDLSRSKKLVGYINAERLQQELRAFTGK